MTRGVSELSAAKRALLEQRLKGTHSAQAPTAIPVRPNRADAAPLSHSQQQMWVIDRMTPGNPAYNLPYAYRLRGALDIAALQAAINAVVARHEILRTTFNERDDEPVQQVHHALDVPLGITTLDQGSADEREERARDLATAAAVAPFDLSQLPLMRASLIVLGESDQVLVVTLHHIIGDGLSIGLLLGELDELYRAFAGGTRADLPELGVQYADYAEWQRHELRDDAASARQIEFWQQRLAAPLPVLDLPADHARPPMQTFAGANVLFKIPDALSRELKAIGAREGCTFFMTVLAAFQVMLRRYTNADEVIIGTPVAVRPVREVEPLVGNFLNMAALRCDLSGDPTFTELLQRSREVALDAFSNGDYPFEALLRRVKFERDPSRNPIFQVLLQVLSNPAPRLGALEVTSFHFDLKFAQFDLSLHLYEEAGEHVGRLEYCAALFDAETTQRMTRHFVTLLEAIARRPHERVSSLQLLEDAERHQLVAGWSGHTGAGGAPDACVHQLVEAQTARTPDRIAATCDDEAITYRDLDRRANQLAHHLRALGVAPDVPVVLFVERSLDMLVAILGILKAGGAYVPIDPAYPESRVGLILGDSGAGIVVTTKPLTDRLGDFTGRAVCLDTDWERIERESHDTPEAMARPDHLAYVLFTSGSTGKPKGVAIEHRSAGAFVEWALGAFSQEELAAVMFSTSVCFDLSVFEMFVTLSAGGKVIVAPNALELPNLAARDEVTLINTVPSAIAELLRVRGVPPSVRTVNLAGEALSSDLVERIYSETSVRLVNNLYGPTETTTYSTYTPVPRGSPVTIGRPISGTACFVLDAHGNPVPIGVHGELYIAGRGVARGYYGQPELTSKRFVPNPFSDEPGARMYRTGDVCRWLPDGTLEYLGRADRQLKVRGFRIEPVEIERALAQHIAIANAVVDVRTAGGGERRLVAYVVLEPGAALTASEIRSYLRRELPEYMVPGIVVPVAAIPLSANGKVDRDALPDPFQSVRGVADFERPRTPAEELLAGVWRELLHVERVGRNDNFFELGGHSLLALRAAHAVHVRTGVRVDPRRFFFQTLSLIAGSLVERPAAAG